jgi:hypothetical protein
MTDEGPLFSDRFGYREPDAEIKIREEAPEVLRVGLVQLAYGFGLTSNAVREVICAVLLRRPDANNWSPSNVEREVDGLIDDAPWYKVYDIAERLYLQVGQADFTGTHQSEYELRLNRLFLENGIGWQIDQGKIIVRGSEAFALTTRDAVQTMQTAGASTAAKELHEAMTDLSRRPKPDITGAIQHAMAALECVAREIDGSTETLGRIINRLPLAPPLDGALHRLWGFASEQGRHIQEGREPQFEDAELIVTVASAVSVFLLRSCRRPIDNSSFR